MTDGHGQEVQESSHQRSSRSAATLADRSRSRQVFVLVIAPFLFAVVAGLTLKWSTAAWSTVQVLGLAGATLGGLEHKHWWSAAVRGAVAGLVAGIVLVLFGAAIPGSNVESFELSNVPGACAWSALFHMGGVVLRRILIRRRKRAELVPAHSSPQFSNR